MWLSNSTGIVGDILLSRRDPGLSPEKGLTPPEASAAFSMAPFCIHSFSAVRSLRQMTWPELGVPRLEKL